MAVLSFMIQAPGGQAVKQYLINLINVTSYFGATTVSVMTLGIMAVLSC
jgi:hypothetical protein